MKHFIPLFALVALSYAQFTSTEGPSQIIGVPGPRWQGPFADNILGQPVGDTPEVAAAKAAHYQAHARILEIVPVLSSEQYKALNYGTQQQVVPQQVVYVPQKPTYVAQQPFVVQQTVPVVPVNIPTKVQAQQPAQKFVQLAEEIPRSELGEVPEVAAARKAHLAAYEEIKKLLPKLEETAEVAQGVYQPAVRQQVQFVTEQPQESQVVTQVPQVLYQQSQNVQQPIQPVQQFVQFAEEVPRSELGEVPEVAAARKAHLAAYEEIKKLLPKLEETAEVVSGVQQPQFVYQVPQTVPQVSPVTQVPQVVFQQPQVVPQEPQDASHQAQSEVYKKQLQRNLEWFYNPQQFYTYVPQDTPEVAAAKIEHLKLLQSFL